MAEYYNPTGIDIPAPNYKVGEYSKIGESLNNLLNGVRDRELVDHEAKVTRERQAAQDARQVKMDLLATPGTAEYAAAQKAKWELEQQNPDVVAQNEFRKVRANAMNPVAMNNELIDAVGKYAGSVDISKMTPEEQAIHWKKLETVGNSLQDSVQQPATAQAYGYMGQSPLMANNTYYQDEMAAKLTAEEMAQATRVTDAYKAKQSLAEKMLDAQAKYANKNGGSITLEDGTTINTGGSGSSKGTSMYDAGKDLEKYENSLYKRIEDLSKSNEDSQYNDPKKVRKLVEDAISKGASPEQLIFDKDKGYISLPEIGNYVEKAVTSQGTRAPFNTSGYDEMMAQQNAIIESGGNLKPAAKTYDNRKILAMLNGEEFIDDTSPALSKVFDDAGVDSKKVGSYLTKAYKAEGGQGDDIGKYKGLGQFAEDTAEPYLKALGKTWADYRKDEGLQRTVMEQFTADNYKKLVKANIEPTEFNLYLMHNQGEGGANAYLSDKPLDQMQSYRLLNQLSNEQIGVDLPRHKSGTAIGQIDINEVQRQGIDLTQIDARGLYGDKFEKKFDNSKEDLISRLGNLGQIKNGSVPKQSVAELFSKVGEEKMTTEKDYSKSALQNIVKKYDNARQFASQENIGLDTAKEVMQFIKEGKFASAEAAMKNNKSTRADDFNMDKILEKLPDIKTPVVNKLNDINNLPFKMYGDYQKYVGQPFKNKVNEIVAGLTKKEVVTDYVRPPMTEQEYVNQLSAELEADAAREETRKYMLENLRNDPASVYSHLPNMPEEMKERLRRINKLNDLKKSLQ